HRAWWRQPLMLAVCLSLAADGKRKLFEVCRMRSLPTFMFINKLDRAGRAPLELLDEIEKSLKREASS
ncbi:MAG: hypothetical protein M3R15_26420, partial [Acidobacteriota bacterium]|nr:hypothetical protein [Acidobacteriota bacterium]